MVKHNNNNKHSTIDSSIYDSQQA